MILSPEVILADEPTGGLDAEMALRLLALLVELNRMGKAVLVATHDADAAAGRRADGWRPRCCVSTAAGSAGGGMAA